MDTQTFIGNAEAFIELLNDMLSEAFRDEIFEENESDFDVKADLDRALDYFCDTFNVNIDKSLITDRDNGDNPIDTSEKAENSPQVRSLIHRGVIRSITSIDHTTPMNLFACG